MRITNGIKCIGIVITFSFGWVFAVELTIDECIDMALSNDEMLQAYYSDLEATHGQVISARGGFFPKLMVSTIYNRLSEVKEVSMPGDYFGMPGGEMKFPMGTQENFYFKTELVQPLFTGGMIWNSYKMAKSGEKAMHYQVLEYKNSLIYNVRKQYLSLLLTDSLISVTEQSIELAENHLRVAEERYNVGLASKYEKLRAEVALTNLKSSLTNLLNNQLVQEKALRETLDIETEESITLIDEMEYVPFDIAIDECREKALSNRPVLLSLDEREEMLRRGIGLAKSGYYPFISVIGGYDLSTGDFNDRDDWQDNWSITLSLTWTPFDGLTTYGKSITAHAQYRSIRFQKGAMEEGIALEIEGLYKKLKTAESNLEAQKSNIELAEEAVNIVEEQYDVGLATNLDVLDAQLSLHQARFGYYQVLYDYLITLYDIRRAMGEM